MAGDKYLYNNAGTITEKAAIQTSAGAGDAGKIPALDAAGKLDTSMMPTGIAADTASVTTSEALAAGDLVNIWNSTGAKARKADATVAGKEAHGFVLSAVSSGAAATVYFEGTNSGVTGLTPGVQYLSTTAGLATATPPSGSGNVVQRVGFATAAAALNFQSQPPVVLA
ncbi:hypothetical protein [Nocardia asiatica]|uniref:hypothetical protein n=1 Tax=Nocardia asiatica TaxID=209252 RepID=UPI002454AEC7|nr:hypothetical protein [Nocardia asiatica]